MNLIANALRFTARGGRITVTLSSIAGRAEIAVSDSGTGIDPSFLPYVFDAFRQGTEPKMNGHGGLGLGLAIVRHLAELHGGLVRAESAGWGHGSTFTVSYLCSAAEDLPLSGLFSLPEEVETLNTALELELLFASSQS